MGRKCRVSLEIRNNAGEESFSGAERDWGVRE